MLESHFVAQKSGNEKGEPGKSPQEEKIKALDRQLNIELKVKAGAENMIETCQRNWFLFIASSNLLGIIVILNVTVKHM